jgi:hypothetical protein
MKAYTPEEISLIKKQLNLDNMPTWIVWAFMDEKGISSEQVLEKAKL